MWLFYFFLFGVCDWIGFIKIMCDFFERCLRVLLMVYFLINGEMWVKFKLVVFRIFKK